MFNRQPFNRGKFNRARTGHGIQFFGNVGMALKATGRINAINTLRVEADLYLTAAGQINYCAGLTGKADMALFAGGFVIRSQPFEGNAALTLNAAGQLLLVRALGRCRAAMVLEVKSLTGFATYRYAHLKLPGLFLRPGDELIIDTGEMTVTLNGQNAIMHLSRDSDFFNFNPAVNEVIYTSGNPGDRVDIRILWKDAYL